MMTQYNPTMPITAQPALMGQFSPLAECPAQSRALAQIERIMASWEAGRMTSQQAQREVIACLPSL